MIGGAHKKEKLTTHKHTHSHTHTHTRACKYSLTHTRKPPDTYAQAQQIACTETHKVKGLQTHTRTQR